MSIFVNHIQLTPKEKYVPIWKKYKAKKRIYPTEIHYQFNTSGLSNCDAWILYLNFPNTFSPAELGFDPQDKRKLSIRLNEILLKKI